MSRASRTTIDAGYAVTSRGWPANTRSPVLDRGELQQARLRFRDLYLTAMDDLSDTQADDMSAFPVEIRVLDATDTSEADSLRRELLAERELKGRVEFIAFPGQPGELGDAYEVLQIAVGAGGAAGILAGAAVQWVRQKSSDIRLKVTIGTTSVEIDAKRVKSLRADDLEDYIEKLGSTIQQAATPEVSGGPATRELPKGPGGA